MFGTLITVRDEGAQGSLVPLRHPVTMETAGLGRFPLGRFLGDKCFKFLN